MRCLTPLVALMIGQVFSSATDAATSPGDEPLVYVGTLAGKNSRGIYAFRLRGSLSDSASELALVPLGVAAEAKNPAFLTVDPKRHLLFSVNEVDSFDGKKSGGVSAFVIEPGTGKLRLINQQSTVGTGPCHLVLDATGRNILVANYASGSVAVLPVAGDGRLGEASDFVQHRGKSVNPTRQAGPHAHCVALDAANRFAFVCDLGLDQVLIYRFDAEHGKLTPADPAFAAVKPGSGPRHIVFRPDGKFAYVVNEMGSSVTVFSYDAANGRLAEVQTVSSLPAGFTEKNTGAEIAVLPDGKTLYASNRGEDTVAQFAIDRERGTLTYVAAYPTGGKVPRFFGVDPSGRLLIAANQNSDTLELCRVDPGTGRLKILPGLVDVPTPSCVVWVR